MEPSSATIFSLSNSTSISLLCTLFTIFLITWYLYYLYCFTYWNKKGVPSVKPQFPAGNILKPMLGQENLFETIENIYKENKKKGHKHVGMYFFNGPVYVPIDLNIIQAIVTTDFEYFTDRGMFVDEHNFPLSANLFSIRGLKWKRLRNKLSPTFTSGKLKTMYEIFQKMTKNFIDIVEISAANSEEINIKNVSTNFTADIIMSTAFGLESNTLQNPENKISKVALNLFNVPSMVFFKYLVTKGFQNPGNIIIGVMSNKYNEQFLRDVLQRTIKYRDENKITRKDFLNLLLEIRNSEGLTFNEMLAQCFVFFLAGFETSSQTISFCIHELAHNQEIQDKLRAEIINTLGKDFTKYAYEDVGKLPYLDKVFNETLRLYPVLGFLNRICVKPYTIPGTDITLEKGTPVLIPVLGTQRDPEYFPDPLKFDPERFNKPTVPFSFMPFGDGPRFCIGMRYGKLQTKLGIAALLSQFKFHPSPKTPKIIKLDKFSKSLAMTPREGITVNIKRI